ncbi:MAG TPA: hypothetical protein VG821_00390 [Rhizomicrobium sp.]|jgi:hypothetical protein|nr:hypothetical protein [Rhizomicrobium sp.]
MTAHELRTALTAILLGTATLGATAFALAAPAQAATVSAKVGTLLKEAQSLTAAGNYKAAMAKIDEAEAAKSSPDDGAIINQMKQYIGVKSGDASIGGAAGAKAKFANDYNAGKYRDVIADADLLRKNGALDGQSQLIIAQAYYKAGDYAGCVRYIRSNLSNAGETALELQARCAYEVGDDDTQRQALETLVARSGKPDYWKQLLRLSERTRGLSDHNSLDLNRIRFMTGNITTKDEYTLLAQLALQLGNATEAQTYIEKGMAAKVLNDDRSARLLSLAKSQAAANVADLQKNIAAAQAQPQGDALVKVGEQMIGQGKAKEAIGVIQQGMKKPLKDENNAKMRLAQAYIAAGQKADAVKVLAGVKAPPNDAAVAHLWSLIARR